MKRIAITLACLLCGFHAFAYKEEVHKEMARRAFLQAAAGNGFMSRLGLSVQKQVAGELPEKYVGQGAYDEDHPAYKCVNHFLDPVHSAAPLEQRLGFFCAPVGSIPADDWALNGHILNGWGLPQMRKYLHDAVLGPNPGVRDSNMRDTLISLGHIVHLVEDMAQPEHTRNDQHLAGVVTPTLKPHGIAASLYEEWTLQNLITAPLPDWDTFFTGYRVVKLDDYHAYFWGGAGMADYANNNFVTQDTNYDDEKNPLNCFTYSQPDIRYAAPVRSVVSERVYDPVGNFQTLDVVEYRYEYVTHDPLSHTALTDPFHTYRSSLDLETRLNDPTLDPDKGDGVYSLSDSSYDVRARYLIPRAVGYSAGLIDRMFRGSIAMKWVRHTDDINVWDVTLTNNSSEAISSDATIESVFKADTTYFNRSSSDDTGVLLPKQKISDYAPGFSGLDPGGSVTIKYLTFNDLKLGDAVTNFERRTIVTGKLGNEPDEVIPLVQKAGATKLKVDIAWAVQSPLGSCSVEGAWAYDDQGHSNFVYHYPPGPDVCITDYSDPAHPQDWCMTRPNNGIYNGLNASSTLTINRPQSDANYHFGIWGVQGLLSQCSIRVTVNVCADGQLDKSTDDTIALGYPGASSFTIPYPGRSALK